MQTTKKNNTIELYCDGGGGVVSTSYIGGTANLLIYGEYRKMFQSGWKDTTNNRMELQACIFGLELIKTNKIPINIYTDSAYVANPFINDTYKNWSKHNAWRIADGSELKNLDLWKPLIKLHEKHNPNWGHVKGHEGNWGNCMCDHLATEARLRAKEIGIFPLTERLPDDHINYELEFTKTGRIKKR